MGRIQRYDLAGLATALTNRAIVPIGNTTHRLGDFLAIKAPVFVVQFCTVGAGMFGVTCVAVGGNPSCIINCLS